MSEEKFGEDIVVAQLSGLNGLIKSGKDLVKNGNDAKKLGQDAGVIDKDKKPDGKPAAAAENGLSVVVGESTPLTKNVEQYMKEHGLPVKQNGILSQDEANTLGKALRGKLAKDINISVSSNGDVNSITFTPKALGALDIDLPQAAGQGQQAAPAAPAAAPSEPNALEKGAAAAKEAGMSVWEKAKAAGRELTKCSTSDHPEYNSQACVDVRAKQPNSNNR